MFHIGVLHPRASEKHKDWSQAYPFQWRLGWVDYELIAENDIPKINLRD